mmetsp:Transcript_100561/g.173709  ORF Transcript_100561/g.173709 Transcript_100561/m.173709 type:complete len:212 (-) Transcript_100561:963-1598(-)
MAKMSINERWYSQRSLLVISTTHQSEIQCPSPGVLSTEKGPAATKDKYEFCSFWPFCRLPNPQTDPAMSTHQCLEACWLVNVSQRRVGHPTDPVCRGICIFCKLPMSAMDPMMSHPQHLTIPSASLADRHPIPKLHALDAGCPCRFTAPTICVALVTLPTAKDFIGLIGLGSLERVSSSALKIPTNVSLNVECACVSNVQSYFSTFHICVR